MFKGLSVCYTVLIITFFSVAISGYWAFGNESEGLILSNFVDSGNPLVPKWFIYMTNIFTMVQLSAVGVVRVLSLNYFSCTIPQACTSSVMSKTILTYFKANKVELKSCRTTCTRVKEIAKILPFLK